MLSLNPMTPRQRDAVFRVLHPGEEVMHFAAPDPAAAARRSWPTAAAGGLLGTLCLPIAGLSTMAAWSSLRSDWSAALTPALFAALSLLACLISLSLLLLPWTSWRRARDTLIAVTNRRLMLISLSSPEVISLPASAIIGVDRSAVEGGHGTLIVRHASGLSKEEQAVETVLAGLGDVLELEAALRTLTAGEPPGSTSQSPRHLH